MELLESAVCAKNLPSQAHTTYTIQSGLWYWMTVNLLVNVCVTLVERGNLVHGAVIPAVCNNMN